MEVKNKTPRLSLNKETITKLSDEQLKKVAGGRNTDPIGNWSCEHDSCDSGTNAGSCAYKSCFCD